MPPCRSNSTLVTGVFPTIGLNALICFSSGLVLEKSHSDFTGYSILLHLISRAAFLQEVYVTALCNVDLLKDIFPSRNFLEVLKCEQVLKSDFDNLWMFYTKVLRIHRFTYLYLNFWTQKGIYGEGLANLKRKKNYIQSHKVLSSGESVSPHTPV